MKVLPLASGAFMMSASTNAALVLAGADRMWGGSAAAAESTCDGACTYTGGAESILLAAEAGCRSIEHASFIDQRGV